MLPERGDAACENDSPEEGRPAGGGPGDVLVVEKKRSTLSLPKKRGLARKSLYKTSVWNVFFFYFSGQTRRENLRALSCRSQREPGREHEEEACNRPCRGKGQTGQFKPSACLEKACDAKKIVPGLFTVSKEELFFLQAKMNRTCNHSCNNSCNNS